jgi:hypothetical protein
VRVCGFSRRSFFYSNLRIVLHSFVLFGPLFHCLVYTMYLLVDQGLLIVIEISDLWIIPTRLMKLANKSICQ